MKFLIDRLLDYGRASCLESKKILFFFGGYLWLGFALGSYAQETPPLINYPYTTYKAHNQNWGLAESTQQILYSANSDGLLEYDGATWRTYPLPNGQIVRSVLCDGNRVYVGGYGEFGYWQPTPTGQLKYQSLNEGAALESLGTEEIWHILKTPDALYFQSFSHIYRYDGQVLEEIKAPGNFLFLRYVHGRLLVPLIDKGLYELRGRDFIPLPNGEQVPSKNVSTVLPFHHHQLLIATARRGLLLWDEGTLREWMIPLAAELKKNVINKMIVLKNGHYAIGTILKGVYIISEKGELLYHFHQGNGLQNNTVLALWEDSSQNLWLGLDKGIDLVKLASPITSYNVANNPLGTTYAAALHRGLLYVGTNSGVFVKKWRADEPFRLIPGLQGQVWTLQVLHDQLLCGHNEGTFLIEGETSRRLSTVSGGWVLLPLKGQAEPTLLQGTYTGLHVYRLDARGQWAYAHKVQGVPPIPIKYLAQTEEGTLWLAHAYKGLYRTTLTPDTRALQEWVPYQAPHDLPDAYSVEVLPWKDDVLIRSGDQYFTADQAHRLQPMPAYQKTADQPYKLRQGLYGDWFRVFREEIILHKADGTTRSLDFSLVRNNETIVPLTDQYYLFCVDNGYVLFDRYRETPSEQVMPRPLIRRVANLRNSADLFPLGPESTIPAAVRDLRIQYALPLNGQEARFRYRLVGLTDDWSELTDQHYVDFTNLPTGQYVFEVQSLHQSQVATYRFRVLPYWYEMLFTKISVGLLGVLCILGFLYYQEKRIKKQKQHLLLEQEEKLRQQQLINEKRIMEIQNKALLSEVNSKSQQLSNIAINVVRKNEILEEIRSELVQVKEELGHQLPNIHYQKLLTSIERNVSGKEDWKLFEDNFNEVHEEFFKRLKAICPAVTPTELRLAAGLRMNLSSKEIAPILGISVRGVEIKRYRLRKKLGFDSDINLNEFMMDV
ncbi:triple tyrosine motif-containing protein [Rhabdobacter roseus]|uniref:HTH luxR-type domain-containing protein n=1 Tax=Rhabdobacter roseus TaxID=1655419 RepID=A0A840THY3_9BACT|nr:triple tyrosine motif-containing protein [Rhabdobacter roseus]MBB5282555.1 hypothetical protein [Rhabdobacter roseus]